MKFIKIREEFIAHPLKTHFRLDGVYITYHPDEKIQTKKEVFIRGSEGYFDVDNKFCPMEKHEICLIRDTEFADFFSRKSAKKIDEGLKDITLDYIVDSQNIYGMVEDKP